MPKQGIEFVISKDKFLPIYRPLILSDEQFDIDFLYGGRDSGKSRHIAMQLVLDCLRDNYFKCLLIRKVQSDIRVSQYDLVKSVIEEWKLDAYFSFNSTFLEIRCLLNGNSFHGRGLDEPARIKSFNNPSCCWIEEGNQIQADDLVIVLTSLRSNKSRVKTWMSFNPECEVNYTEFWLWQDWFSHTEELSFKWIKPINIDGDIIEIKVRATHGTYRDNPFVSSQRKALYESYRNSKNNAYWYQVYTLGLWGYRKPEGVFWKCFQEDKHTLDMSVIPQLRNDDWVLHIAADNNVAPYIALSVWIIDLKGKALLQIGELPCKHPDNTATKAAQQLVDFLIRRDYQNPVYVYGDPSANAKSTTDDEGRSFFDKFMGVIKNAGYRLVNRVGKSTPSVAQSGSFINEIYEHEFGGWKIFIDKFCRKSIEDYNMTVEAMDGTMLKKRVTDKASGASYEKYGHFSDIKRYFICTVLSEEYKQFMQRRLGVPQAGGAAKVKRYKQKMG